jgi:hypothetical protein
LVAPRALNSAEEQTATDREPSRLLAYPEPFEPIG